MTFFNGIVNGLKLENLVTNVNLASKSLQMVRIYFATQQMQTIKHLRYNTTYILHDTTIFIHFSTAAKLMQC